MGIVVTFVAAALSYFPNHLINTCMWMLLLVVLSIETPNNHKGSVFNLYRTESECLAEKDRAVSALTLKGTKVSASCTYKDYLTPNSTF